MDLLAGILKALAASLLAGAAVASFDLLMCGLGDGDYTGLETDCSEAGSPKLALAVSIPVLLVLLGCIALSRGMDQWIQRLRG